MHRLTENQIRISVRNLVEFILRSGSIDNRRSDKNIKDAMLTGGRLHRKIQASMGVSYRAEVSLKQNIDLGEITLTLEGRADGILTEADGVTIDEIKVIFITLVQLEKMEAPEPIHMAQALCYAYMYANQNNLDDIKVQITYCEPETETIRRFVEKYDIRRLKEIFDGYINSYAKWARFLYEHRRQRNMAMRSLEFPYSYREGQRGLVVQTYRSIMANEQLMIQAPTGIGKTMATLFPAVAAMGQGEADKIFYLTAKTITRSVAQEAAATLQQRGLPLSAVTITAKEKLCLLDNMDCNPVSCLYADGHFDRVNDAVYDLITHEINIDRETTLKYAKKHRVCPFEMCLDVTYWVDTIICDYNYVFDPSVRLQRFFADGQKNDFVFLIDEAHNLVDRAREMYSASLQKESFLEAKKWYHDFPKIIKLLENCNRKILALKRECDEWKILPDGTGAGALVTILERLYEELLKLSERNPSWVGPKESTDFFFQIRDFLMVWEEMDENYRVYTEHAQDGTFWIHELCINPSRRLQQCCAQGISSIFFSATLLPITYYKELICADEEVSAVYAKSPFDQKKRLIGIGLDVSTKYTRRTTDEYERYAFYIEQVLLAKKGNYLVFFPSYRYLQNVCELLKLPPEYKLLVQELSMTEEKKEEFLDAFRKGESPTLGLCVTGGIFSEGIDLQKEALIGVLVAGTGLAQVGPRQEVLRQFYEEGGKNGFLFAYLYPGMNKVLQAAGRLIRTSEDYGIILLLDERFLQRSYKELFPVEWDDIKFLRKQNCKELLDDFWRNYQKT